MVIDFDEIVKGNEEALEESSQVYKISKKQLKKKIKSMITLKNKSEKLIPCIDDKKILHRIINL